MAIEDLQAKLKSKNYGGVYFLCGDEEYTKDYFINKLRSSGTGAVASEYDRVIFDKASLSSEALLDAVESPSFTGATKIIEITGFALNQPEQTLSAYIDILSDIPENTVVMFIYRSGEFDSADYNANAKASKNVFLSFVREQCVYAEFNSESGAKLIQWIQKHFRAKNTAITDEALRFLPEYCGNDMYVLSGEIDKLCSVGGDKPLTVNDVMDVCCANTEYKLFDIINCISASNTTALKKLYDGLVYSKVKPELILGTISSYFVDLLTFRAAFAEGHSVQELKSKLGYRDFQASRLSAAARKVSDSFVAHALDECRYADSVVKNHSSDPYTIIELMLYRISAYGNS